MQIKNNVNLKYNLIQITLISLTSIIKVKNLNIKINLTQEMHLFKNNL